jgi:hypothetical protein
MKRIHFIELEDQPWFPGWLRDYGTDYLRFLSNQFDVFKGVVPLLTKVLGKVPGHRVVDMASGGTGGWRRLAEHLQQAYPDLKVTLSDYYPNLKAFEALKVQNPGVFDYSTAQVDARNVPHELKGLRTQLLSMHHFKPEDVQQIIGNAVAARQPIALLEVTERSVRGMLPILFSPLTVLLTTPFIGPFRLGRLVFTYLIPLVPLFVLFDGVVSVLRTYTVAEMKAMAAAVPGSETYDWEIRRQASGPGGVMYLIGSPKE